MWQFYSGMLNLRILFRGFCVKDGVVYPDFTQSTPKDFAEEPFEGFAPGFPGPSVGLQSAKAARGVAEDVLTRGLEAEDLDTATGPWFCYVLLSYWPLKI